VNIIFVDDSKSRMEQLFNKPQLNGKIFFMELLENKMIPITLFFGNHENEIKMLKPVGQQEVNQFLDNYADFLSDNKYDYDTSKPKECILKKDDFCVDVNKSAFLLYDKDDLISQKILQRWDDDINGKLKYNAGKYNIDDINKFLEKLKEKISTNKGDIILIDMLLIIDDHKKLEGKKNEKDLSDEPILSMIIYNFFQTQSVKCAVYSTFTEWEMYKENWVSIYNKFFTEHLLDEKDSNFIIDRNNLNVEIIKELLGNT